jgi:hypothetical protein
VRNIVEIDGKSLELLLSALSEGGIRTLRVAVDESGAKFKINEGMWSDPLGTINQ